MPQHSEFAQRFPTVEAATVEWNEHGRPGEGPAAAHGGFAHSVRAAGGTFEPLLPCPSPGCQGGGFEISEAIESMVSNRQQEKAGVLVCIGWESAKGMRTEQSPCTQVISYRIKLTYRKTGGLQRRSKERDRSE